MRKAILFIFAMLIVVSLVAASYGPQQPSGAGSSSSGSSGSSGGGGGGGSNTARTNPICASGYTVQDGHCVKATASAQVSSTPVSTTPVQSSPVASGAGTGSTGASVSTSSEQSTSTVGEAAQPEQTVSEVSGVSRSRDFGQKVQLAFINLAWLWVTLLIVVAGALLLLFIRRMRL